MNETLRFPFWCQCISVDCNSKNQKTKKRMLIKKPHEKIFLNKNIGSYETAKPQSWNWVSKTGFHYDTRSLVLNSDEKIIAVRNLKEDCKHSASQTVFCSHSNCAVRLLCKKYMGDGGQVWWGGGRGSSIGWKLNI